MTDDVWQGEKGRFGLVLDTPEPSILDDHGELLYLIPGA